MKKIIIIIIMALTIFCTNTTPVHANTTDLNNAKTWTYSHYSTHTVKVVNRGNVGNENNTIYIERVKTRAISKTKGKVVGTKYMVKYPKKVKKGKKITVYMIYDDNFEITAMVCLGKVKDDRDVNINCPCCNGNNRDCPYWLYDENRHMTEEEINDFEFWEGHYIDEEGNVIER